MIRIKRSNPVPATLTSQGVIDAKKSIRRIVDSGGKPKAADFLPHWGKAEVRTGLWKMQHGKCCYCERLRDVNRESDIEHFRPKTEISEEPDPNALGYWWLAYEWANLFFSCRTCNQEYKKNQFPLQDAGKRAKGLDDNLHDEKACLVNPAEEDPKEFIGFDWQRAYGELVFPYGLDGIAGRGEKTIELVGLRRSDLNVDRASLVLMLQSIVTKMHAGQHLGNDSLMQSAKDEIAKETSSQCMYAGFRRAFFRAAGLDQFVSND